MRIEPELGDCGIVLLGHFNPLIFSPSWFAKNGIVSDEEAAAARVSVIHPQIAAFQLGKLRLQVEEGRFSADTTEAPWISLCDFVAKTFGEFLIHTPVNQMGINRHVHFSVGDEETRNKIGRLIAPLSPWGAWGVEMEANAGESRAGCVNLTMLQPKSKSSKYNGHVQVQIQPSTRIRGGAGVFVAVNDHYSFGAIEETIGCEEVVTALFEEFEKSVHSSEEKIDIVMAMRDLI